MHAGGSHTDSGLHFQFTWSELEAGKHINRLELRAAWYALLQLASPGDVVQLHLDITTAITYIRKMGRTHSLTLCKESHLLWCQAIRRNLTLLPPQWISTQENTEVDFLSRHRLQRWDFKLSPSVLEDLLETTSLAHPGCLRVQWESSGSQVHDLGAKFQVNSNRCPGLLLGSSNLVFPLVFL